MSETNEAEKLRTLIEQDEQALASLQKEEDEIVEHVAPPGFRAATSRKNVIWERQTVMERLRKNRKRLAELEH